MSTEEEKPKIQVESINGRKCVRVVVIRFNEETVEWVDIEDLISLLIDSEKKELEKGERELDRFKHEQEERGLRYGH